MLHCQSIAACHIGVPCVIVAWKMLKNLKKKKDQYIYRPKPEFNEAT